MAAKRVGEDWIPPLPEYTKAIPPLPPVRTIVPDDYVGPTEESNWVIHGRLLVGAYPSSVHDDANTRILSSILRLGLTTFVCLQQEYQHEGVSEAEWRSGFKLRPYIFDAIRLVDALPASHFPTGAKPAGLEFIHFPIQDCAIAHDASVLQLATDLVARLVRGENMYVHCLDEDAELLTSDGFMGWREVQKRVRDEDFRVAALHPDTHALVYERASAFVLRNGAGQACTTFHTSSEPWDGCASTSFDAVSINVTTDHDMLASLTPQPFRKVKAGALAHLSDDAEFAFLTSAPRGLRSPATCDSLPRAWLDGSEAQRHALCRLLGCLVRSPCVEQQAAAVTWRCDWMAQRDIHGICTTLGLSCPSDYNVVERGMIVDVTVLSERVLDALRGSGVCRRDRRTSALPSWVFMVAQPYAASIITSAVRTDAECGLYITAQSAPMRDALIRLALHAGFTAQSRRGSRRGEWDVQVLVGADNQKAVLTVGRHVQAAKSIGRTWCVSVPSGLIIARRVARDAAGRVQRVSQPVVTGNCWGGHGRTGTVVSIMLGLLYGLAPLDAMRWVQFCHDLRIAPMGVPSPQTEPQRQQVIRVLNAVRHAAASSRAPSTRGALLSPQPAVSTNGEASKPSSRSMSPAASNKTITATNGTSSPKPATPQRSKPASTAASTRAPATSTAATAAKTSPSSTSVATTPVQVAATAGVSHTPPAISQPATTAPMTTVQAVEAGPSATPRSGTGVVARPLAAPVTPASMGASSSAPAADDQIGFKQPAVSTPTSQQPTPKAAGQSAATPPQALHMRPSPSAKDLGGAAGKQRPSSALPASAVSAAGLHVPSTYTVVIPSTALTPAADLTSTTAPSLHTGADATMATLANMPSSLGAAAVAHASRPASAANNRTVATHDELTRGPSIAQLVASALGTPGTSATGSIPPSPSAARHVISRSVLPSPKDSTGRSFPPSPTGTAVPARSPATPTGTTSPQLTAALDLAATGPQASLRVESAIAVTNSGVVTVEQQEWPSATGPARTVPLPSNPSALAADAPATAHVDESFTPRMADGTQIGLHAQSYVLPDKSKPAAIDVKPPQERVPSAPPSPSSVASAEHDASRKPMMHISPRPASSMSLTELPSMEAVLKDPVAMSVDPLAASAASVLGLGALVAARSHVPHTLPPRSGALSRQLQAIGSSSSLAVDTARSTEGTVAAPPVIPLASTAPATVTMNPYVTATTTATSATSHAQHVPERATLPTFSVSLLDTPAPAHTREPRDATAASILKTLQLVSAASSAVAATVSSSSTVATTASIATARHAARSDKEDEVLPAATVGAVSITGRSTGSASQTAPTLSALQRMSQPLSSVVPTTSGYTNGAGTVVLIGATSIGSRPATGTNRAGSVPSRVRMAGRDAHISGKMSRPGSTAAAHGSATRPGSASGARASSVIPSSPPSPLGVPTRPASRGATAAASPIARSGSVPKSAGPVRRHAAAANAAATGQHAAAINAVLSRPSPRAGSAVVVHEPAATAARAGVLRPRVTVHNRGATAGSMAAVHPDAAIAAAAAAATAKVSHATSHSMAVFASTGVTALPFQRGAAATAVPARLGVNTSTAPAMFDAVSGGSTTPPSSMMPQPPTNAPTPRQRSRLVIATASRGTVPASAAPTLMAVTPPAGASMTTASPKLAHMPLTAAVLASPSSHTAAPSHAAPIRLTEHNIMQMVAAIPALAAPHAAGAPVAAPASSAALKELLASLQQRDPVHVSRPRVP